MKTLFIKDKNRRNSYSYIEKKKIILNFIIHNLHLSLEIRNYAYHELINLCSKDSFTKIKNRCLFTNRARGIYRKFKLSRIVFKQYALQGDLIGIKKAS